MLTLLTVLALAAPNPGADSAIFRGADGGWTLRTTTSTSSGGGVASDVTATQGAGQDGGAWVTTAATKVSTVNATTAPLGSGATFTGTWESTQDFGFMNVTVYSDQSVTDGLRIDWSADGTNLDASDSYDVTGGTGRALAMPVRSRYMRLRFTNGATPQATFRLNVLFRQNGSPNNTHPVDWPVSHTSVATLSRSVIVGETTSGGGSYVNVKVTPSGALASEVVQSSFPWLVAGADGGTLNVYAFHDGGIAVTNFPASQAVTGTFWQATQPVSIATMPTTPVTGTFWQTTQPVSGPLTDTQLRATAVPVSGTLTCNAGTGTLAVSMASAPTTAVTQAAGSISGSNPCVNPTATLSMVSGSTSGTASVQLVALSGSTKIYVCSMMIVGVSGTSPTFSLTYGTGSACATGNTVIVGAWTTAANTVYNFGGGQLAVTAAGNALCYVQTGTTPVSRYVITYVQI